jgi:L-alanine-DL-glutamate epimerase-like enolase superfamily enzyme
MTNTIVRILSDEGCDGISGISTFSSAGFDFSVAETLRQLLPELVGIDPLAREYAWNRTRPSILPVPLSAQSAIDIALWDLLGKRVGLPVWQLVGGMRDRIPAYASTPMLQSAEDYVNFVTQLRERGFRAIKFHAWCEPDRDLEMVRMIRRKHGDSGVKFMFDAENRYDRGSALRVAHELQDLGFHWFEAPLPDLDLDGYRELRKRVQIPILPAGNWLLDLQGVNHALITGAWDAARTDVCVCGGITAAQRIMAVAQAANSQCELQCWGYTLSQAANLHVMLGLSNCSFFEQPVPEDAYEFGMIDVIRTHEDGYVYAPSGAGLGVRVDWDAAKAVAQRKIQYPMPR